jgi:polysaccharide deacetylase 2 family uncharacterized protein YibQ
LKRGRVSAATVFFGALSLVLGIVLYVKTRPAPPPEPRPPRSAPVKPAPKSRDAELGTRDPRRESGNGKRETKRSQPPVEQSLDTSSRPRLAVIVDDLGNDAEAVERIASWRFPVSGAVLPALPGSEPAARALERSGKEVLLHLPMEPKGYPAVRPGPGVVLTSQSEEEITRVLESDLASVPGAVGVNNHMGSVATADRRVMRSVAGVLSRRGLFFVDSRTTDATVAREAAEAAGVPAASRRVFLDDTAQEDAIRRQLAEAVARARSEGSAIAIGHPHATTLAVLEHELPQLQADVHLVRVSELVK